jgi:hypothetical protein
MLARIGAGIRLCKGYPCKNLIPKDLRGGFGLGAKYSPDIPARGASRHCKYSLPLAIRIATDGFLEI